MDAVDAARRSLLFSNRTMGRDGGGDVSEIVLSPPRFCWQVEFLPFPMPKTGLHVCLKHAVVKAGVRPVRSGTLSPWLSVPGDGGATRALCGVFGPGLALRFGLGGLL